MKRTFLIVHLDVRFKNNGLESIEIQDNGSGVSPADFETIGNSPDSRDSHLTLMPDSRSETLHLKIAFV